MAGKTSGLGWTTLTVKDAGGTARDIRNDVNSFQFAMPLATQDVTGVDKYAFERIALLADFSITLNGAAMNNDANKSHDVFSGSRRIAREVVLTVDGQTTTNTVIFTDYSFNRGADGSFPWSAPGVLSNGVDPTWT